MWSALLLGHLWGFAAWAIYVYQVLKKQRLTAIGDQAIKIKLRIREWIAMKVVLACQASFKGTLSSREAGEGRSLRGGLLAIAVAKPKLLRLPMAGKG